MADTWTGVLDDLDGRLTAAEAGALQALDGWSAPTAPLGRMTSDEQVRALAIQERQRALETELRRGMASISAARASTRIRGANRWDQDSGPVYIDRSA